MNKKLVLTFLLVFTTIIVVAQNQFLIKGLVFKNGLSIRLSNVAISSKLSKTKTYTDQFGNFSITTQIGDTLIINKEGFVKKEVPVLKKQNVVIYMDAIYQLEEVVVKEQSKKQQQQEVLNDFRSKGVFYNGNPPLLAYIFQPLTALNELIGRDANNAKKFSNYISRENAESEVDRHFNDQLILKTIKIKPSDLAEFKYLYRPKPDRVIYWNVYDDMKYIKDSYQKFLRR